MKLGALLLVVSLIARLAPPIQDAVRAQEPTPSSARQAPPTNGTFNPKTLSAELERIDGQLRKNPKQEQLKDLQGELPSSWVVETAERIYTIPTDSLRILLNPKKLGEAREYLASLRNQLESYDQESVAPSSARAELDRILTGSQFKKVRPPSPWELWRQRVNAWLIRQVERFLRSIARHPIGAKILFWVLLAGGVASVAFLVYRMFLRRDHLNEFRTIPSPISARSWQEWVRAAREAAARGDYREAIHSAYWAGITRLQDSGALPRDRAKTPREYLRALAAPRAEAVDFHEKFREPLTKLTTLLERTWYAKRGAGSDDFRNTLQHLEALGCPLD
ncbi:MAG: DUF4129 domain-containing protein [Candidatus Acidiferrales bacterium]